MNPESDQGKTITVRFKTYFYTIKTRIISLVSADPLLKGVLIIGSGSTIAQILSIIFVPIITRIYPPDIYGTLTVFLSLLSLLLVGSSLAYETTIPLPEKDDDAEYLLILSLSIVCIFTIILLIILTLSGEYFAGIFHFEFIKPYYWLFCIGFFGISIYQILTLWNLRSKDYMTITRTRISQSISGSVSKIILGLLSLASFGLICGDLIGRIVGIGSLGRTILPKIWFTIHELDFLKLKGLAYTYRKFPAFSLPSNFINTVSLQVPALFLSSMFGFETVGLYSLSYSMLVFPVSFISGSIGQVFIGESSEVFRHKRDQILSLYLKTTKNLFKIGAPIILTGAILSPVLFPIIFGNAWKEAGMFSLPLSMMVIAQFVVASTDRLELYGYNHWELAYNISRTLLVLTGFYLAIFFKLSPMATILLYSSIMTVMYGVSYMLNIKAIKRVLQKNDVHVKN